jgi:Flp pilus assembly protein TadD
MRTTATMPLMILALGLAQYSCVPAVVDVVEEGTRALTAGRTDEAIEKYDRAIQMDPSFSMAHYMRGMALRKARRFREAADAYAECLRLEPRDLNARSESGEISITGYPSQLLRS